MASQRAFKRLMRAASWSLFAALWLSAAALWASTPGTWSPKANLNQARAAHTATLLNDGRVLIVGGKDANSAPRPTAEVFDPATGLYTQVAMNLPVPVWGHTATLLNNGSVLIAGGRAESGNPIPYAQLFDPSTTTFLGPRTLSIARSEHTATLLKDGRVLLAGGTDGANSLNMLELYDPIADTFSPTSVSLQFPRKDHVAARLDDGKVLVAGGSNSTGALSSAELYDPQTDTILPAGSLSTPRTQASAALLLDNTVFLAGGKNLEGQDLNTAEIYDPTSNTFTQIAALMSIARSGHVGVRLQDNGRVILAGGTNAGQLVTIAEVYDPLTQMFLPVGSPLTARTTFGANFFAVPYTGGMLATGGQDINQIPLASSELFSYPTLRTDKQDYPPGVVVKMMGEGWQPNEIISILIHENNGDPDLTMTVSADAAGAFDFDAFQTDSGDLGFSFLATATGPVSHWTAQAKFTDAAQVKVDSVSPTPFSPNQASSTGVKDTTTITVKVTGGTITNICVKIRQGTLTSGTIVRDLFVTGSLTNGTATVVWNGKDNSSIFVPDGTYTARAVSGTSGSACVGGSENTAAADSQTIVVDNTNPVVTLNSPADNTFVTGNVSLTATPVDAGGDDSNIMKVEFYVDSMLSGTATSGQSGVWDILLNTATLTDGSHTWNAKAFDKAGNNASTTTSRMIKVDNTNPTVTVNLVPSGSIGSPITITGIANDTGTGASGVASVAITITGPGPTVTGSATNTGTNFSTWSFTYTPTAAQAGSNSVVAKATDNAGNLKNSTPANFTVNANSPPTVAASNASVTVNEGVTAMNSGTYSDANAGDDVSITASVGTVNKTGTNSGTWSWSFATTDGPAQSQTVTITANDGNGGITTTTFSLTVTNVAPTATFNAPTPVNEGSAISLSLTGVSDPSSVDTTAGFTYAFDCGDGSGYGPFSATSTASCPTTNNGTRSVKGKVKDKDNGVTEYTASVTINNVAPTAALGNNGPVNEGSAVTISFSAQSDPSSVDTTAGFHYAFACDNSSLAAATYAGSGANASTQCTFNDNGTPSVRARIIDKDDGFTEYTTAVSVLNIPPTVTPAANQTADEGTSKSFTLGSFTDPGTADNPWAVDVNWGDGSPHTIFNVVAVGSLGSQSHSFPDNGTYTVTVKVTDKDGGSDSKTFQVVVANVPPTATINGAPATSPEGTAIPLTSAVTDPSPRDTAEGFTYTWTVTKNGNPYASGAAAAFSFTPDDNATYVVTLSAMDKDGGTGTDSKTITVTNVPPTAGITGAPASSPEGTLISLGSTVTDPSSVDTAAGFTKSWSVTKNGSPYATGGNTASFSFTPDDNGIFVVSFSATDKDGGMGTDSKTINVLNVPPSTIGVAPSAASINENGSITLSGSFTDPGVLDTHRVQIDWGDGSPFTTFTLAAAVTNFVSPSHQYLDDNPTGTASDNYTITVTVTDKDGGSGGVFPIITVNNVAPVIASVTGPTGPLAVSSATATITANFTDVGSQDTHTCTFSWDDSTPPTTAAGSTGSGSCSATHTYTAAGVYEVGVAVTDDDTGSASSTFQYVVVYDPNGGFVTGGGWIMSPAGAYVANPSLTGKANFGFVSKYQKGATIPVGETEFQFQVANFNFHSSVYEWLVVSGPKAQYKGSGTVNGSGDYGFLLTATDGQVAGVDKFRIKIWDKNAGGAVVYDNVLGTSDDIDAANPQVIGGGSIVVHK